jgi:hypothetical protein
MTGIMFNLRLKNTASLNAFHLEIRHRFHSWEGSRKESGRYRERGKE